MFNHISLMQVPRTLPYLLTVYVSFPAVAPGVSNVNWDTDPFSGSGLDFFGLTDGAGTTIVVVPEPATAGLLALGLIGLARARQRSLS